MAKENKDKNKNEFLSWWEVLTSYIVVGFLLYFAYKKENSLSTAALIIAALILIFIIVFRKRPNSSNFIIGVPSSKIDIRWHLKKDERMPGENNDKK
jgi:uncharacterized membrane protein